MNNSYLEFETPIDADAHFRNYMRYCLEAASKNFDVAIVDKPVFGWRLRSIGAKSRDDNGNYYWLRVKSELLEWPLGEEWLGNWQANSISSIRKPKVLKSQEWEEVGWRRQRAELIDLMQGEVCSPQDLLSNNLDLSNSWWNELEDALKINLPKAETSRILFSKEHLFSRISNRFGSILLPDELVWTTVHGDLHWSNLMRPKFAILDWEMWGRGPEGLDAATLLYYSINAPEVYAKIETLFETHLSSPTGLVSQLYVVCRLMDRIEGGDYPELLQPLNHFSAKLLRSFVAK